VRPHDATRPAMELAWRSSGREANRVGDEIEEDGGIEFKKPYQDGKEAKIEKTRVAEKTKQMGLQMTMTKTKMVSKMKKMNTKITIFVVLSCVEYLCNHWM
jgi:hypothetical protein